jgi:alkylhydroperoxidase family enzyme
MRLVPITAPKPLSIKIAYFVSRKLFGKVLSAINVIYARCPPILSVATKIVSVEKKLSLDKRTRLLIRNFVSQLNDCKFCSNTIAYLSQKDRDLELQQIKELLNYRESDLYTPREKALLAYLEEVTYTKVANDETFNALKAYFKEREIVEATWICATENYYNLMAKPLGLTSDELKAKV